MFKYVFAAIAALAMPIAASAATVTLDSQYGGNTGQVIKNSDGTFRLDQAASSIVYLDLAAGTYDINALAGSHTAWNRWSNPAGCDANGENCAQGYEWSMAYFFPEAMGGAGSGYFEPTNVNQSGPYDRTFFATGQKALDAVLGGPVASFTLEFAQKVGFFINDDIVTDNVGSVQFDVSVAPVPLPAPGLLLAGGVVALGALRRRRKAA